MYEIMRHYPPGKFPISEICAECHNHCSKNVPPEKRVVVVHRSVTIRIKTKTLSRFSESEFRPRLHPGRSHFVTQSRVIGFEFCRALGEANNHRVNR